MASAKASAFTHLYGGVASPWPNCGVGFTVSRRSPPFLAPRNHRRRYSMSMCANEASPLRIAPKICYGCIQHVGMLVEDTEIAKRFYMDVLGMSDDHALRNPKLPFGGTFVRAGNSQVHLMELPSVDPKQGRPAHGGRDKHAAITVKNLDPLIESLEKNGVTYTFSQSGRRAVFLRDIDMNALEFVEDANV